MSITDKTRKLLWGRSGNRCAFCKCELVMDSTDFDDEAVVGDECHIIARATDGPRGESNLNECQLNAHSNLILLCKTHHKLVDDQPETHSVKFLQELKLKHEKWVRDTLGYSEQLNSKDTSKDQSSHPNFLTRLLNGTDILHIMSHAHAYDFGNDELETEDEVDLVGSFLQNAQDWGELLSTIESGQRVKATFSLTSELRELEKNGFMVFGNVSKRKLKANKEVFDWLVAIIRIVRNDSPSIISIESSVDKPSAQNTDPF